MALVECKECGRAVSERAESCPACGCPIRAVSSVYIGRQLEKRIKVYKNNGYMLRKRSAHSAEMLKMSIPKLILLVTLSLLPMVFFSAFVVDVNTLHGLIFFIALLGVICYVLNTTIKTYVVTISIDDKGNLLESGKNS